MRPRWEILNRLISWSQTHDQPIQGTGKQPLNQPEDKHMYALTLYAYLSKDFITEAVLYTHHQHVEGFLMIGAFTHSSIFFVWGYNPKLNKISSQKLFRHYATT